MTKSINVITGISDHNGVLIVDSKLKASINKKPQRKIPIWSRANRIKMKEETFAFSNTIFLKIIQILVWKRTVKILYAT